MSKTEVDSTVLSLAVIAGAAALLLIPSGQSWLCGAVGLILLITLFAYDIEGVRSILQSFAFSAVCGFTLAVATVPIAPTLFSLTGPADPLLGGKWLPLVWLGSTILFMVIDRARMSGRIPADRAVLPGGPSLRIAAIPNPPYVPPQAPVQAPVPSVASPSPPPAPAPRAPEPVLVREEAPPPVPAAPPPTPTPAPVPVPSGKETNIYVNLTGEGLNLLRSVRAEHIGRDYYRIVDVMPEDERWEYPPGAVVRCKKKNLSSGKALVAFEEAPRAQ